MHLRETIPRFIFYLFIILLLLLLHPKHCLCEHCRHRVLYLLVPFSTSLLVPHPLTRVRRKTGLLCHVMGLILQNGGFSLSLGSEVHWDGGWSAFGRVKTRSASPGAERCPASVALENEIQLYVTRACLACLPREEFSFLTFTLCNWSHLCLSEVFLWASQPCLLAYCRAASARRGGRGCSCCHIRGRKGAGAVTFCYYGGSPGRSVLAGGRGWGVRYQ